MFQYYAQGIMLISRILAMCTCEIGCIVFAICFILFLFVKFVALITGFHTIGIIILFGLFYYLLWEVGQFALYPGSFTHVKSQYQMNGSKRMAENLSQVIQNFFGHLNACASPHCKNIKNSPHIYTYLDNVVRMLDKFRDSLSPKKKQLCLKFKELNQFLMSNYKVSPTIQISIELFLTHPITFHRQLQNQEIINNLAQHIRHKSSTLLNQISEIIISFNSQADEGICRKIMFRLYEEKLFEMRFVYNEWDKRFVYNVYQVETSDNNFIECAVIDGYVEAKMKSSTNKAVLLGCPNGAFIQYYVFDCGHVAFYLEMGYKVILWNYRGYGYSTGNPSLTASISDIQNVYLHCKDQLDLDPIILHGYSIGGPPCIHLANKYQNDIRLLVVDRSFSRIRHIAGHILPALEFLYKWVFYKDAQVDNSSEYIKIKNCHKIIIWDVNDEVIPDACSLKRRAMIDYFQKNYFQVGGKVRRTTTSDNKDSNEEQMMCEQLDLGNERMCSTSLELEDSEDQIDKQMSENFVSYSKVLDSMVNLFVNKFLMKYQVINGSVTISKDTSEIDISNTANQGQILLQNITSKQISNKEFFDKIISRIGKLDAAGDIFFSDDFMDHFQNNNQKEKFVSLLKSKARVYFYGLVLYGSYTNENGELLGENCLDLRDARVYAMEKLEKICKLLESQQPKNQQEEIMIKSVLKTFKKARVLLANIISEPDTKQAELGTLLPTKVGHNGELMPSHYSVIRKMIHKNLGNLKKDEDQEL